ncbi:hypothetical protein [Nonomuraea sp. NPDC003214]
MNKQVAWWRLSLVAGILLGLLGAAAIWHVAGADDAGPGVAPAPSDGPLLAASTWGNP